MEKVFFSSGYPEKEIASNKRSIMSFFNLHNIWWMRDKHHRKVIDRDRFKIFPDGKTLSRLLKIPQQRGPNFTKRFFLSKKAKSTKHFFIGLTEERLKNFSRITGIDSKNVIPYHSDITKNPNILILPESELKKICSLIEKNKPDYVWVGISSPKQEFIASQLFDKAKVKHFICIGAGLDFLLKKKKEAPVIWQKIGIEWFYRLITDFSHSKQKVWRSFQALSYIIGRKVKIIKED